MLSRHKFLANGWEVVATETRPLNTKVVVKALWGGLKLHRPLEKRELAWRACPMGMMPLQLRSHSLSQSFCHMIESGDGEPSGTLTADLE